MISTLEGKESQIGGRAGILPKSPLDWPEPRPAQTALSGVGPIPGRFPA